MDLSKNSNSKNNSKSLDKIKGPDVFTTDLKKGFIWTVGHTKLVAAIVGICLVGGGSYAIFNSLKESKEREAQAKYYDIDIAVTKKRAQFEAGANPNLTNPETAKDALKATGDLSKDYGTLTNDLSKFVDENPSSVAGAMAALNLASLQSEYKDPAAALATLKKVNAPKGLVGHLLQMELASLTANAGNCAEAVGIWDSLIKQESAAFLKSEAKLKMGLCAESAGDKSKAEALYREVESEGAESAAGRAAKQYLRLLSQQKG